MVEKWNRVAKDDPLLQPSEPKQQAAEQAEASIGGGLSKEQAEKSLVDGVNGAKDEEKKEESSGGNSIAMKLPLT